MLGDDIHHPIRTNTYNTPTLFYFHQFPTLFLFTNLVAVPLSSMILITEIVLCFIFLIGLSVKIPADIITQLIHWLNSYILQMEHIPFGMIKHIFIGIPTLCALYIIIFLLFRLMISSTPNRIKWLLISVCALSIIQFSDMLFRARKARIVVLNIPGQTCVLIQKARIALILGNEEIFKDSKFNNIVEQLRATYWIKEIDFRSFPAEQNLLNINIGILSNDTSYQNKYFILLTKTAEIEIHQLNIPFEAIKGVIVDRSNKLWKIRQWETESDRLLLRFHSVAEAGPFIFECIQ